MSARSRRARATRGRRSLRSSSRTRAFRRLPRTRGDRGPVGGATDPREAVGAVRVGAARAEPRVEQHAAVRRELREVLVRPPADEDVTVGQELRAALTGREQRLRVVLVAADERGRSALARRPEGRSRETASPPSAARRRCRRATASRPAAGGCRAARRISRRARAGSRSSCRRASRPRRRCCGGSCRSRACAGPRSAASRRGRARSR